MVEFQKLFKFLMLFKEKRWTFQKVYYKQLDTKSFGNIIKNRAKKISNNANKIWLLKQSNTPNIR